MKKILLAIICVSMFFVGGCISDSEVTVNASQDFPLKIWFQNENGSMQTYNIVDEATGVHYVVVSRYTNAYSEIRTSTAICPRYNADGTLYTE